jgi:hypothetical protein
VHGKPAAMDPLEQRLQSELQAKVSQAVFRQTMAF